MSQTHTHPAKEELKKHGDPLTSAIGRAANPVPPADNGGHSRSPAAHLGDYGKAHTKPAGNLRQGATSGALREPPQQVSRIGKQHRGQ